MSLEGIVNAKMSDDELKNLIVRMQEITSDDVVKKDIVKDMMWKRSSLISVGEKVLPIRNMPNLEEKWYFPNVEDVSGEFPVPEGATAFKSPPVSWVDFSIKVEVAEYRFMITDFAKARGMDNWQYDAQVRAGSDFFARSIDKQILDAIYAGSGATAVTIAAGAEWDSGAADMDPEGNIIDAWNNILAESNVGMDEINKVCLIYPAKVDSVLRSLKLIGNIQQSLQAYLKGSYGFSFYPTRYYDETGTTKLQDDALLVINSEETGVHVKYTGGVVPLAETSRVAGRGTEYVTKQIFGTKIVPTSTTVKTNKRVCTIANVI